jgi:hypothetical protein
MMPLEDMLTTAFREKAADIQPGMVPPLRPAPGRALRPAPGRGPVLPACLARPGRLTRRRQLGLLDGRKPWRWLAPAASAVLVIAVIAGAVLVSRGIGATRAPETGTAGVPRYYVALTGQNPHQPGDTAADVRATATRAVLARVTPPRPYSHFIAVAGAADDRTFVLAAQAKARHLTWKQSDGLAHSDPQQLIRDLSPAIRFYVLRIDPAGRASPLKALPTLDITAAHGLTGMALSPDGTQLALIVTPTPIATAGPYLSGLQVLNLVTGARRSWTNPGYIGPGYGDIAPVAVGSLAWTADGRTISFISNLGYHNVIRLLNVSAPGPSLLANSRIVPAVRIFKQDWRAGFVTPDGKTIIGIREYTKPEPPGIFNNFQDLVRFSAAVSAAPSVLSHRYFTGNNDEQVLWSSSSGQTVVVTGARPGATAGIVHGHRYTRIPWSASILTAAW